MHEQRRFPRFDQRLSAWCEGEHWTLRAQLVELSAEGMRLRSAIPDAVGSRLRVSFSDGSGRSVTAIAEVRWSRSGQRPATGLRVVEMIEGESAFRGLLADRRD